MSILTTFYLFAPAFVANAAPVVLTAIPAVRRNNAPLWESQLGTHKTWGGFLGGVIVGIAVSLLQYLINDIEPIASVTVLHTSIGESLLIGAVMGVGALGGDAVKSFFKRRIGIKPGRPLPFIDGVDHIVGSVILLSPFYVPPTIDLVALILASPLISLAANTFSYLLGWKRTWH